MKCLNTIDKIRFQPEDIKDLIKLYQFKGKDFYYQNILKKDLKSIAKETIEKECFTLAKYLNLKVTENRLRLIIKKDSSPKTNDEKLIYNIKNILHTFNDKINAFDISATQFLRLGEKIFFDVKSINFNSIITQHRYNLLTEDKKVSKRDLLEEYVNKYEHLYLSGEYEIVSLISAFYIDYINHNFFNEENEFIGLFIIYSLLFKAGFNLFKYSCFFENFVKYQSDFKNAVLEGSFHYEEGFPNNTKLTKVLLRILNESYEQVDSKVRAIEILGDNNKTDIIENTIYKQLPTVFTKEMIMNLHPNVSPSTIDRTLRRMRDDNIIRANGQGRKATWIKLVNTKDFDTSSMKQITLFDELDDFK